MDNPKTGWVIKEKKKKKLPEALAKLNKKHKLKGRIAFIYTRIWWGLRVNALNAEKKKKIERIILKWLNK